MAPIGNSKNYRTILVNRINELKNDNYLKFQQINEINQVEFKKKIEENNYMKFKGNDNYINNQNNQNNINNENFFFNIILN